MAPGLTADLPTHIANDPDSDSYQRPSKPLIPSGALDRFSFEETTPVIGREYHNVNIVDDLLNAPNADDLLRDLAIAISQRGVVFFRAQDNLTNDLQKGLVHRLGLLAGKPSSSTLHVHPVLNAKEMGVQDNQISHIDSAMRKRMFTPGKRTDSRKYDSAVWHSDIQYESNPADYTSLRLTQLPSTGGDTLWASGYELYDRFSEPYQKMFESLTATFVGDGVLKVVEKYPQLAKVYEKPRGSPANVGQSLSSVHPVVRTNPVTGWKSLFAIGPFAKQINELSAQETADLKQKFLSMVTENHDLQCRFKWKNRHDFAIWDNRCAFHTATFDYDGYGERFGYRAVGVGEAPFFDPNSKSRLEALAEIESIRAIPAE